MICEPNFRISTLVKCNYKGKFKTINRQFEIMENENTKTKKCPRFERCSHNIYPLDIQLFARIGFDDNGKQFTTGESVMPVAELILVPRDNVERLNDASQKRWRELNHSPWRLMISVLSEQLNQP